MIMNIAISYIKKHSENSSTKSNVLEKILYFLIVLPSLFILVNNYPYLLIFSVLILVFLGFIFFLYKKEVTSYHKIILSILIIIYTYLIISYFFSNQSISNFLSYSFLKYDGNFFFCYILFFVLAVPFFDYKKVSKIYFKLIFFVFSAFSIFGIFEYFSGYSSFMIEIDVYAGKIFKALNFAHNATGSVYAVVSIFALIFFLKERKKYIKLYYLFVLLICLMGLFLTKSRGSYLGFMIGALFVLWINFRSFKKFVKALLGIIIVMLPLIFFTGVYKRIIQIFDFSDVNILKRLEFWDRAWYLFSKSPIFGIGYGRFNDIYQRDLDRLIGYPGVISFYMDPNYCFSASHAHNSYLQFLTEIGILGLVLLITFWSLCFIIIFKAYQNTKDEFSKKVFLSGMGSIVTLFALSLTENYFSATTVMICISTVVSISVGLYWQEDKYNNVKPKH